MYLWKWKTIFIIIFFFWNSWHEALHVYGTWYRGEHYIFFSRLKGKTNALLHTQFLYLFPLYYVSNLFYAYRWRNIENMMNPREKRSVGEILREGIIFVFNHMCLWQRHKSSSWFDISKKNIPFPIDSFS